MAFVLTDGELAFIKEQRIGRLATASPKGAPDVAPALAIYRRSLGAFLLGGQGLERTRRYQNARRNPQASLVFDALSWEPYELRGVKVAGSISIHVADEEINLGAMGSRSSWSARCGSGAGVSRRRRSETTGRSACTSTAVRRGPSDHR